jgi:hypothetical protein
MCTLLSCFTNIFEAIFKKQSPIFSCCENINCTCLVRKDSDMSLPHVIPTIHIEETSNGVHVSPKNTQKRKRSTIKKSRACKSIPTVFEILQHTKTPPTKPQIVLDNGWCMYMGDAVGERTTAEYLHIRHIESLQAIAVPEELTKCLLQGLVELQK